MGKIFWVLIWFLIKFIFNLDNSCRPGIHQMIVILDKFNDNKYRVGLSKFKYTFILLSTPEEPTDQQIIFSGKFPVNINIDLYEDLIYFFIPNAPFCLTDLINNRQGIILGNFSQYKPNKLILNSIYIEIEEILMNKPIDIKDLTNEYYLINNFKPPSQYVLLLKKINSKGNQFFQIFKAEMKEIKLNQLYCKNEEDEKDYNLNIGNVVEISPQFGEQNYIIKEGLIYKGSIFEPYFKTFILNNIEVYICLLFQDNKYSKECFFE